MIRSSLNFAVYERGIYVKFSYLVLAVTLFMLGISAFAAQHCPQPEALVKTLQLRASKWGGPWKVMDKVVGITTVKVLNLGEDSVGIEGLVTFDDETTSLVKLKLTARNGELVLQSGDRLLKPITLECRKDALKFDVEWYDARSGLERTVYYFPDSEHFIIRIERFLDNYRITKLRADLRPIRF